MINNWWDFGEWRGSGSGDKLALYQITCPFCFAQGNFSKEHEAAKKKPNGRKTLHFDTLMCGNCAAYVLVFWSAAESGGMHDYHVIPWPIRVEKAPAEWPEEAGCHWVQAHRSLMTESWDGAALLARSAMQSAFRERGAKGKNLKADIDDLAAKGILPPLMKEWANEVRELGNDAAHPSPTQGPTSSRDANDIVKFLDYLMDYLYTLPNQIKQYRQRNK